MYAKALEILDSNDLDQKEKSVFFDFFMNITNRFISNSDEQGQSNLLRIKQ